jgi:hypothetical protein
VGHSPPAGQSALGNFSADTFLTFNCTASLKIFRDISCGISSMPSDKTEKKRKRASDRHERPTKKAALGLQALPPLKASLVEDKSELAPVIGEWNGNSNTRAGLY